MADVADKPTEDVKNPKEEVAAAEKSADAAAAPAVETEEPKKESDSPAAAAAAASPVAEENGNGAAAADDVSKLERSIIRQVEYYFGDANLNRDKFLLEQISKNEEGWVPLSVLLTFKRLSQLSDDAGVIVASLLKSDDGLIEISEDKEKVRRHPERPIPEHNEERRKEIMSRTAYAKGFPLDIEMSDLLEFFAPYDKVVNINMRKYLDKPSKTYKFKGSVFATFEKKEQTKEFVEQEKVLFKERELVRKWQENYLETKKEEMKAKSKSKKSKPAEEEKFKLPGGTVLFFEGGDDSVTRELLRESLEKVQEGAYEVAYIDYSKGEKTGHIRLVEENIAAKFLEHVTDKKLKLKNDVELTLRTLETEEEQVFLAKAIEHMKNRRSNHHNKHKGGHGGGGGGHGHHHGNRKRRGGHDNRHDEKKKRHSAE